MAKKQKYYVVWEGAKPGVYGSWEDCQRQIAGVPGAKYKSFENAAEAQKAFKGSYWNYVGSGGDKTKKESHQTKISRSEIIKDSLCVDAACSGNPGIMEYRGVYCQSAEELFHQGPFRDATNNIGEFLALVHGLAYLQKVGKPLLPIYSDSRTAIGWIKAKKCNTKLDLTAHNKMVFELIERAEQWLKSNTYRNPIIKWETEDWGEIPADFGRKG
jgi:ribonuclease HI